MTQPILLHWVEHLTPGGIAAVIEELMRLGSGGERIVCAPNVNPDYLDDLRRRGLISRFIGDNAELLRLLESRSDIAIVLHCGGNQTAGRDSVLDTLTKVPSCPVLELNTFGYVDDGPSVARIDLHMFSSMHTTWRHWVARGRPPIQDYLNRHRTLYYPVALKASAEEIAPPRARARTRLGIPANAFVIGDVCRPDPRKLDYMLAAIAPRLEREIGFFHIVTQRFPEQIARELKQMLGARYHNLPFAVNREELLESYGVMDVFGHFSTMGESFGMAVAEATRCGLPIVANETPGCTQNNAQPELVKEGETGFFANDPYTAVQRLAQLARSPALRDRMGEAGRRLYTVPPLEPISIVHQVLGEALRIGRTKGNAWTAASTAFQRIPSLTNEEAYLTNYRSKSEIPSVRPPLSARPWLYCKQASRLYWRARRRHESGFPVETRVTPRATTSTAVVETQAHLTIVHWLQNLTPGGGLSVLDGFKSQTSAYEEHVFASSHVDPAFENDMRRNGYLTPLIADNADLLRFIKSRLAVAVVVHSGGEQTEERDRLLDALVDIPHCCVLERNIFGFADNGPSAKRIELHFFNSMHTMWRHWIAQGRPPIEEYLRCHHTLYNPVTLAVSASDIAALRARGRARLGIPQDAFVIGDVCRPDPGKLDYMLAAIAPRLEKEIGPIHIVTKRFPDKIVPALQRALGARYHNLTVSTDRNDILETYAMMDVFGHFSTMGESFGMAVAEAMRCGLPVVVNETPGINQNNAQLEIIVEGKTGFFANTPYMAVRRLTELARSPDLRRRLGEAGRARFAVPPLDPTSIARQLTSEIMRLAIAKGIRADGMPPPATRVPLLEEEKAYLSGYRPGYRTQSLRPPIADIPWALSKEMSRFCWRVNRRRIKTDQ